MADSRHRSPSQGLRSSQDEQGSLFKDPQLPAEPLEGENEADPTTNRLWEICAGEERLTYLGTNGVRPVSPIAASAEAPARSISGQQRLPPASYHFADPIDLRRRTGQRERKGANESPMQYSQSCSDLSQAQQTKKEKETTSTQTRRMVAAVGYASSLQYGNLADQERQSRSMVSGIIEIPKQGGHRQLSADQKCRSYVRSLPGTSKPDTEMNTPFAGGKDRSTVENGAPLSKGLLSNESAYGRDVTEIDSQDDNGQANSWSGSQNGDGPSSDEGGFYRDASSRGGKHSPAGSLRHSKPSERSSRPRSRRSHRHPPSLVGSVPRSSLTGLSSSASQRTLGSRADDLIDKFYEIVDDRLKDTKEAAAQRLESETQLLKDTAATERKAAVDRIASEARAAADRLASETQLLKDAAAVRIANEKQSSAEKQKLAADRLASETQLLKDAATVRVENERKAAEEKQKLLQDAAANALAIEKEAAQDKVAREKQIADVLLRDRSKERLQTKELLEASKGELQAERDSARKLLHEYHSQNVQANSNWRKSAKRWRRQRQMRLRSKRRNEGSP